MEETYPAKEIYHERQKLWFCGQLQNKAFSKEQLDDIALNLSKKTDSRIKNLNFLLINPHKSVLGIGNYDINVLEVALNQHDLELQWFDARRDIRTVIQFTDPTLFGIILNTQSSRLYFWSSNHWIAVKPFFSDNEETPEIYNLDSKLSKPLKFDNIEQDGQVFIVKRKPNNDGNESDYH
ncbi:5328_t:CDS:2 [Dentiscutata erythropus]|uniref:ubiquitinyl hydrolase 1 n=1 Tax=Dentiscutata erythropus TaxID=1348616 RepID=A0A9N8Z5F5_9GLOM|nr:5328_t:CDS:2 [Dentiscutata erythropus]